MMKKILLAAILASLSITAHAEGHYVPGVEGVNSASVPPPGTYYIGYLVNYDVDALKAPGTDKDIPVSNTGSVTALANRLVHITDKKMLGADYGMELIVPIIKKDFNFMAANYEDSDTGVGDVYLGPLVLGWHGDRWDSVVGAGIWLDNGDDEGLAYPGNGYRSTMLTGGGTWHLNEAKSLSFAGLLRYEMHGETDKGFEPGDQLTLEWGLGKQINPALNLGLVGYTQWQTSDDKGAGASGDRFSRQAFGLEASYLAKSLGGFVKAAFYTESSVEAGSGPAPTGNLLRFTFVKPL